MKRCMNKALIEMLRTDLQEAIKGVEEKYKLHINCGDTKFTSMSACMNLDITFQAEKDFDPGLEEWKIATMFTAFTEDDYGKVIELNGKPYTIVGYNKKARSNSVKLKGPNGNIYVAHNEIVLQALGRGPTEEQKKALINQYAPLFGLDIQYGDVYKFAGKRYKICSIKPSSKKYPIVAVDLFTNKEVLLPLDALKIGEKE